MVRIPAILHTLVPKAKSLPLDVQQVARDNTTSLTFDLFCYALVN